MLISLAAGSLASGMAGCCFGQAPKARGWSLDGAASRRGRHRSALVSRAGTALLRIAACLLSAWNRRWLEATAWAAGIALFFAFFAWHVGQVKAQLAGTEVAASPSLAQWLRFGGLDFVLLTTRLNSLLFAAAGVAALALPAVALVGLGVAKTRRARLPAWRRWDTCWLTRQSADRKTSTGAYFPPRSWPGDLLRPRGPSSTWLLPRDFRRPADR